MVLMGSGQVSSRNGGNLMAPQGTPMKGKSKAGGTKTCPKCGAKVPAGASKCPQCGYRMK
jgi:predicted amidophosphoribosyltransferase